MKPKHLKGKTECQNCHQWLWNSAFNSTQEKFKHPWCLDCRELNKAGARAAYEHARAKTEYQSMSPAQRRKFRNKLEGESLPEEQQLLKPKGLKKPIIAPAGSGIFCPCGNELSRQQINKNGKRQNTPRYCSRACANADTAKQKDFLAMGEKGNKKRWHNA